MKEFESDCIINEFKDLFEQAFGKVKQEVAPRQKADLIAFFLAGAQCGMNIARSLRAQNIHVADVLLEEFFDDNNERAKFCVECMVKEDYSHSMFK